MKLYRIVTEFPKYRLAIFLPFFAVYAWGALKLLTNGNAKLPTLIFLFALLAWAIIWLIGWFSLRKHNKENNG